MADPPGTPVGENIMAERVVQESIEILFWLVEGDAAEIINQLVSCGRVGIRPFNHIGQAIVYSDGAVVFVADNQLQRLAVIEALLDFGAGQMAINVIKGNLFPLISRSISMASRSVTSFWPS